MSYYLVKKDFLESYYKNKEKLQLFENNLTNSFKQYLQFLKEIDFIDYDNKADKECLSKFGLLVDHTSFVYEKFKENSIHIGQVYYSYNVRVFYNQTKSLEEIKELLRDGYVIVDEHWMDVYEYYDTYEKFINCIK